jgi:hypothetical protein
MVSQCDLADVEARRVVVVLQIVLAEPGLQLCVPDLVEHLRGESLPHLLILHRCHEEPCAGHGLVLRVSERGHGELHRFHEPGLCDIRVAVPHIAVQAGRHLSRRTGRMIQHAPVTMLHHTSWQVDDVDEIGRGAKALLDADPGRHVWGLG